MTHSLTTSAAAPQTHAKTHQGEAWLYAGLAVLAFSGSLPATRLAVMGLSPLFVTGARGACAAVLGGLCLLALRAPKPSRGDLGPLLIVAGGAVIGFPLLTALALQSVPASHSIVFTGLLPLATAGWATCLGEKRPSPPFWLFSGLGAISIVGFALHEGVSASPADALLVVAVLICGLGYAVGARLGRRLGGWQVICWALLLALPVMAPLMLTNLPPHPALVPVSAWLGLGYVTLFSMLIGFFFWYRGLALGDIASVGQLQLLQPFLGLVLAACVLHETVSAAALIVMTLVMACVLGARRFSA